MKYTKHVFYSIIFTSSLLVLGACGNKDNVDLSEASSINEDDVTSEYYGEMSTMLNSYSEYVQKVMPEGVNASYIEEESRKYLLLTNGLELLPISQVDKELDTYVFDIKIQSELVAENMIDYASSKNISDKRDAQEYVDDSLQTFEMIKEVFNKYGLE